MMAAAISGYLSTETVSRREEKFSEAVAELSAISPSTREARRSRRRAAAVAMLTSESEDDAASEADYADERPQYVAASGPPGLEDDTSLRFRLDSESLGGDLHAVVASTLGHDDIASPSGAGRRVRDVLRQLEKDLVVMSQECKRSWRAQQAEQLHESGGSGGGGGGSGAGGGDLAVHMQNFFAVTREHVTLALKHVESAAGAQSEVLQQQLALCLDGLLGVATHHVRAAVTEQSDEVRAVIQWQRRERQEQLQGSRLASSVELREAVDLARTQAADEQAAAVEAKFTSHAAAMVELERQMNEERVSDVATWKEALRESKEEVEVLAEKNDRLGVHVSDLTDKVMTVEASLERTESQLAAAAGANKRLEIKLKASKTALSEERDAKSGLELALAQERKTCGTMVKKLASTTAECATKIAAADAHLRVAEAELDQANEELSDSREQAAAGSGSGDGKNRPGSLEAPGQAEPWMNAAFDLTEIMARDSQAARVPSQALRLEEARLMAAVERAAKAGMAVHLLMTPQKDKNLNSPANLAKMLRTKSQKKSQQGTAAPAMAMKNDGRHTSFSLRETTSFSLREALAYTHKLFEHASRSLEQSVHGDGSPAQKAAEQWKEKTALPSSFLGAVSRHGADVRPH